jgi:hypothetical protein
VSIKNKLVTAVTTAGLLAGLFGSAFVPSVNGAAALTAAAAASTVACVSSATDTDVIVAGSADGTCYAKAASTVSVTVTLEETGGTNEVGDWASVILDGGTGATIVSYTASSEVRGFNIVNSSNTANISTVAVATTELAIITVAVKAPALGATYTYSIYDGAASSTSLGTLTIVGSDATKSGVASATTSSATAVCTAGTGGSALAAGGGALCATSQVPTIAADGIFAVNVATQDAFSVVVTTAGYMTATVSGSASGGIDYEADGDCTGSTDETTTSLVATPDGADAICFTSDGTPGLATITITTGPLSYVRNIMVLGSMTSIVLSAPTHMTSDDSNTDSNFYDAVGVICKDLAGNQIGDGGGEAQDGETAAYQLDGDPGSCIDTNLAFTVLEGNGAAVAVTDDSSGAALIAAADRVAGEFSDEANGTLAAGSEAENGYWDIPSAVCAAGEAGDTRTIKVTNGLVESNTVTLTCVANKVSITSLTALATGTSGSATGGANGQTIKVSVAATDGSGRPAGLGSGFTFTATRSDATATAGTAVSFAGGTATLTITLGTNSGAQYVIYSATDANTATTGAQAFAQKISYTGTNGGDVLSDYILTKSGGKVTGSNFSSRATVKVEVENASKGTVKVYTRKANAAGKVVYTLVGRGTFYVTMYTGAAGAEVLSNTVTVRR